MSQKQIRFTILLTFSTIWGVQGQNLFTSNLYNNLVFSNPSLASVNDYSLIKLNYRNQWPIDGVYNTYGASVFHSAPDLNSNFGGILNYDRQLSGVFTTISMGASYSYQIQTNQRNYLSFGFSGFYNIEQLNYSNLTFENPLSATSANQSRNYPLLNTGVSYFIDDIHAIGISVVNVFPFVESPLIDRNLNLTYLGHIDLRTYRSILSYLEPVAHLSMYQYKTDLSIGINLGFYAFKTGILISQSDFKINTTTILLGISFENYEFIYTYDLNLSGVVSINPKMAAHEVTFLRKYQYKGRSKRHKAIKCPDI